MRTIRQKTFETNSSSTHSISVVHHQITNYFPYGKNLKIKFFDEETILTTLKEKVSYLVSHIINWYKWDAVDYEDLIDEVKEDKDFKRIEEYVKNAFGRQIVFPKEYQGDIEEIVEINHQLLSWEYSLDEILNDLTNEMIYEENLSEEYFKGKDLLEEVLKQNVVITFGRD